MFEDSANQQRYQILILVRQMRPTQRWSVYVRAENEEAVKKLKEKWKQRQMFSEIQEAEAPLGHK